MESKVKLLVVALALVLVLMGVSADSIASFNVPTTVPLNQEITATGVFTGDDVNSDVLCAFLFFDMDDAIITRASDEYTLGTGRFILPGFLISEPTFVRGQSYRLSVECGGAVEDANFYVEQKQELVKVGEFYVMPDIAMSELRWWVDRENSLVIFLFVILGCVVLTLIGLYWSSQ